MTSKMKPANLDVLREKFADALQENALLANYTTARVGGPAAAMLHVHSSAEMEEAVAFCAQKEIPWLVLGSGSNLLFADAGYEGLVLVNRMRNIRVEAGQETPSVLAESGANFSMVARQVALRGLSGLEWAAAIPGTVGGAVYGNAGAFGSDVNQSLLVADILQPNGKKCQVSAADMAYSYRSSALKEGRMSGVILSARFRLSVSEQHAVQAKMNESTERRRQNQPPGASMGSMFKNPPGDYAGRLIEAAGLKGRRVGGAEISQVHANFFVNDDKATAADILNLIRLARQEVADRFGVQLELEIELRGDWHELPGGML